MLVRVEVFWMLIRKLGMVLDHYSVEDLVGN